MDSKNSEINLEEINYELVECPNNRFTEEAKEKIKELLTIKVEGNSIYLCHPRHVFEGISEDFETKVISKVDWNSINIEMMKRYNDYGEFTIVEQLCYKNNNQYSYLSKRVKHMMKKYQDLGIEKFACPIAVVEEAYEEPENTSKYFARGIICATKNGFALGTAPNYTYSRKKESVWEKGLRLGDNY